MNGEIPKYDLVGMNLSALQDLAGIGDKLDKLCECIQSYAQQPGVQPCETFPFNISGSVVQTVVCHILTFVMQVPKGMTATVTRLAMQERYPGTLYGSHFFLGVNDNLDPTFPRIDNPVGQGIQNGIGTRICLQEQDLLWIMTQCSWTPVVYTAIESTYQQTLYPFQVTGFFENKRTTCG